MQSMLTGRPDGAGTGTGAAGVAPAAGKPRSDVRNQPHVRTPAPFSLRRLVRGIHLWIGLGLGGLFALLGLTGSALVFYVGIDAALHPAVRPPAIEAGPGPDSPAWDRALATGRARHPDPASTWSIEVTGEGGPIPARYYPPSRHHDHHSEREMIWFSADGRHIVRAEPWGGYLMSWLYELHMHLLAGEAGRLIVGWSGTVMLLLLLSGVAAWWPRGAWRKAIAFKRRAAPIRRLRDLHKLTGLGSALLLIILVATGVLLALPEVKAALIAATPVPAPRSGSQTGRQIPIADALAAAQRALPDARLAFIDVPAADDAPFRLRMQVPGDPHRRFPGSFVFVDQYSGAVLAVHDLRSGTASVTISAWIRGLHDGSAGGLFGRCLAILIGLTPTLLFATGLLHWRRRTRRAPRPIISFA
ncbi:PepSY-associated TM helix domain-containing protein [Sphingomonas sp. 1P06PA]|uniref:PepSY-associated TM helix domain-containing protein n=1 Tax=Sphingomonas sp. 1P06PA TaxID=554121 RepID=UPI0039A60CAC